MSDKQSKKLAKKLAKKAKNKSPNRKLKSKIKWVIVLLLPFLLSRPLSLVKSKTSIGEVSKIGAIVSEGNGITAQFVSATSYEKASLVEVNILVDLSPSAINFNLKPEVYDAKKRKVKDVKIEKINAYYYTIFISNVNISKFQCYIYLPKSDEENSSFKLGSSSQGLTISSKTLTKKSKFIAKKSSDYATKSQELLTQKYEKQLKEIDEKIKKNVAQSKELSTENQQLVINASGLTQSEKQQVLDQVISNNNTISSLKSSNTDLEKSKNPINDKIKSLKSISDKL